jgi:hypothetical protein
MSGYAGDRASPVRDGWLRPLKLYRRAKSLRSDHGLPYGVGASLSAVQESGIDAWRGAEKPRPSRQNARRPQSFWQNMPLAETGRIEKLDLHKNIQIYIIV